MAFFEAPKRLTPEKKAFIGAWPFGHRDDHEVSVKEAPNVKKKRKRDMSDDFLRSAPTDPDPDTRRRIGHAMKTG